MPLAAKFSGGPRCEFAPRCGCRRIELQEVNNGDAPDVGWWSEAQPNTPDRDCMFCKTLAQLLGCT
ncbi:MAG: hypothetical protein KDB27_27040, partial [Planctomycetales bacterium]|nr:hypothetical protein [Planctomycetales bacterium]